MPPALKIKTKKPTDPTVMENDSRASEHHKARWWRIHVMHLSIDQLAEYTGYTSRAIYLMELGINSLGRKVKPWVWQRYKCACCAVAAQAGKFGNENERNRAFDWQ